MANFVIPDNPEFSTVMRRLEKNDPAAAELFNTMFAQLLENDAYCDKKFDGFTNTIGTENLETTAQTIIPAINEVVSEQKKIPEIYQKKEVGIETDGVGTWNAGSLPANYAISDIAYGKDKFVGVTMNFDIVYSEDGKTWILGTGADGNFSSVVYAGFGFVANNSEGITYFSDDGITWHIANSGGLVFEDMAYGNGVLVAVGSIGIYVGSLAISGDLDSTTNIYTDTSTISWSNLLVSFNGSDTLYGVTYGDGKFVAVGEGVAYYSTDGINWYEGASGMTTSSGFIATFRDVTYGNGKFVAAGCSGYYTNGKSAIIYHSTDGVTWTSAMDTGTKGLEAVTYGNGAFVAVGLGGIIYTSLDGIAWNEGAKPGTKNLLSIAYANNTFIAGGAGCVYYAGHAEDIRILEDVINDLNNNKLDSDYNGFVKNDSFKEHGLHLYYDSALGAVVDVTDFGHFLFENSNLKEGTVTFNISTNNTPISKVYKYGRLVQITTILSISSDYAKCSVILTLPSGFRPIIETRIQVTHSGTGDCYNGLINTSGQVMLPNNDVPANSYLEISTTFISGN